LHLLPQHRKQPLTELECRWAVTKESEVQACAALFSRLTTLRATVPAYCEHAFAKCVLHLHRVHTLTIALDNKPAASAEPILGAVAQTCTQLRHFAFSGAHAEVDTVASIVVRNRYLTTCCPDTRYVGSGDSILHALAQHCPLLQRVTIANVGDRAVIALTSGCKHLLSVHIERAGITDAALVAISTCRKLRCICLKDCLRVTEAGLASLVAACSQQLFYLKVKHPAIDFAAAERIRGRRDSPKLCVAW
jgi:hypothetical protein